MAKTLPFLLAALILAGAAPAGHAQDVPGQRFEIRPADLPSPAAGESARNPSSVVARPAGATPAVPPGFTASLFAEGLRHPRNMLVLPNGDVLLAEQDAGVVTILRDADGDGRAETVERFADGFAEPYGLALHGGEVWVADTRAVWRLPYTEEALSAGPAEPVIEVGSIGSARGHSTRSLAIDPSGRRFFVGIGSVGNIAEEQRPRATIQVFDIDGANQRTFASGLRNPVGLEFYPGSEALYAVVNERDGLGDELVPDYMAHVEDGQFYGWPYAYIGPHPQPGFAERAPQLVARATTPELLFEAHSAPLGFAFYDAEQFPEEYRGDAFVALHGSWNRADPTGYKVVRVPFEEGRPLGWYENFATGFRVGGGSTAQVWGRPADVAVAADGALLVADDVGGTIWRIAHEG